MCRYAESGHGPHKNFGRDRMNESEIEWNKISPYRQQMLGSFGYTNPDHECNDWENDSLVGDCLNYKTLGCVCCDNLISSEHPPLGNNKICIWCDKGHRLVVGVLKEDLE